MAKRECPCKKNKNYNLRDTAGNRLPEEPKDQVQEDTNNERKPGESK